MTNLLLIDTATNTCSVAISQGSNILHQEMQQGEKQHAKVLPSMVQQCLQAANLEWKQISAVAISIGPGSYTGLRVGLSFVKGICTALKMPMISISTLEMMACGMIEICKNEIAVYIPLIDARRMEVYAAAYNNELEIIEEPYPTIVSADSWKNLLAENNKIIFGGTGAFKTKTVFENHPKIFFVDDEICLAEYLLPIALRKFNQQQFSDVAYSEPFYLKEFNERI